NSESDAPGSRVSPGSSPGSPGTRRGGLHRRRRGPDLAHGRFDLEREQRAAALGRGTARIAIGASRLARERELREAREIDALRMDRHQLGRVGDPGMLPDALERLALSDQQLVLLLAGRAIIVVDADDFDAITRPFARELLRHRGLRPRA